MPDAAAADQEALFECAKEAILAKEYLNALEIYSNIDPHDDDTKQRLCLNMALCLRNMSKATGDVYEQAAMTAYLFGLALHEKTQNIARLSKLRSGLDRLAMMKGLAQEVYAQGNPIMSDLGGHVKPADFEMDLQSFYNRSTNFDGANNPYRDAVGYVLLRQLHAYMQLEKPDDIMVDLAAMEHAKCSYKDAFGACVKSINEAVFDGKDAWLQLCGMFEEHIASISGPAVDAASMYQAEGEPNDRLASALQCRFERVVKEENDKVALRSNALQAGIHAAVPQVLQRFSGLSAQAADAPNNGGSPSPEAFAAVMRDGLEHMRNAAIAVDPSIQQTTDPNFPSQYAGVAGAAMHTIFSEADHAARANANDLPAECAQQ